MKHSYCDGTRCPEEVRSRTNGELKTIHSSLFPYLLCARLGAYEDFPNALRVRKMDNGNALSAVPDTFKMILHGRLYGRPF